MVDYEATEMFGGPEDGLDKDSLSGAHVLYVVEISVKEKQTFIQCSLYPLLLEN